jgi:hypothetical protein
MKAPLIAVISVGIAAATPAVAVSADQAAPAGTPAPGAAQTDLHQPIGPVTLNQTTKATKEQMKHTKLVRRYLRLRQRANRLVARLHHNKPHAAGTAVQVHWSNHGLHRALRVLRKRVTRLRARLRDRRSGLTPAVRGLLARIAYCESKGNPRAISASGTFRGKYQFSYGTWHAVGGRGDPARASEREQDRRAAILLARSGSSPWPVCG